MAVYLIDYENVGVGGLSGITQLYQKDRVVLFYGNNTKTIPFDRMVEISRSSARVEFIKTERVAKNYLDFQLTTYLGYLIGQGTEGPFVIVSKDTGYDSACDFWRGRNVVIRRQDALEGKQEQAKAEKETEKTEAKESTPAKKSSRKGTSQRGRKKSAGNQESAAVNTEVSEKAAALPSEESREGTEQAAKAESSEMEKAAPQKAISPGMTAKKTGHRVPLSEGDRKKVREALKGENLAAPNYTTIYRIMDASPDKQHFHGNLLKAFGQERGRSLYEILKKAYEDYSTKR